MDMASVFLRSWKIHLREDKKKGKEIEASIPKDSPWVD